MPSKEEVKALLERYSVEEREIVSLPGHGNTMEVDILRDGQKIGTYARNYSDLFDTFVPFFLAGSVYALYSPDYTTTRLMRLPECADIGGEEPESFGFCPTGFYVPYEPEKDFNGQHGFVCGCIWGDDSSWKIQHLDLTEAAQGIIKRSERFGYIELPDRMMLRDAITFYNVSRQKQIVRITHTQTFDLTTGKFEHPFD